MLDLGSRRGMDSWIALLRVGLASGVLLAGLSLGGCSSTRAGTVRDPLLVVIDREASAAERIALLSRLSEQAATDEALRAGLDASLAPVVWRPSEPTRLRLLALDTLAASSSDATQARLRTEMGSILPREPDRAISAAMAAMAAKRKWNDLAPALVRSLARRDQRDIREDALGEIAALRALATERTPEATAWELALDGQSDELRADAWDVLVSLAASEPGTRSQTLRAWITDTGPTPRTPQGVERLDVLRRGVRDLNVVPESGREVAWLASLVMASSDRTRAWWNSAQRAVAGIPEDRRSELALRHLAPLVWAFEHEPALVASSRDQLLDDLARRIDGRGQITRSWGAGQRLYAESLERNRDSLTWGDALALHVIDRMVRNDGTVELLVRQAQADRADRSSEHGGLFVQGVGGAAPEVFAPVLFPPSGRERVRDDRFVAPQAMIRDGDLALAHYHFHAMVARNSDNAGPSEEDLAYARRFGRTCIVLTSVGEDALNVDVFTPRGTVVDLGVIGSSR